MKNIILVLLLIPTVLFGQKTTVTRVIDGDTFVIESGERVRMVGINAPEISDLYGQEAKQHLQQLIEGKEIELLPDHLSKNHDRYSRMLRYAVLNGVDIDKQMLLDGFAVAYLKFKFDKPDEYKQAQIDAQNNSAGMWHKPNDSVIEPDLHPSSKKSWLLKMFRKRYFWGLLTGLLIVVVLYRYLKK
ncbi:thermonuclease family protein [Mucilaginibacter gracilis]|uniref:thermonuclease family protein n=1 Tax=Mucilaginibacter gracilis TaxID=423350 RepID=UPI0013C2C712|nr:thermonuclease family protein [Mucilaginibacter gracilis]